MAITTETRRVSWPFLRSTSDRMLAGVAGGISEATGIRPIYVRAAFASASLAAGVGAVVYVVLALLVPEAPRSAENQHDEPKKAALNKVLGLSAMFLASLLILQSIGLWFGAVTWPGILVIFGLAIAIDTSGINYEQSLQGMVERNSRRPWWLVVAGLAMMVAGLAYVLNGLDALQSMGALVLAIVLALGGFMIVAGPWLWSLIEDLQTERRARIRSEERAEMAAHLHDSVLQTLALIQRTDDPKKMVTLARAQERDLRSWLYDPEAFDEETLKGAIGRAAAQVEENHDVPVTVVVVGDSNLTIDKQTAIVSATKEAMMNAARHSGADTVSVFAEASDEGVEIFITDQGKGFDVNDIDADRRGIAESISGRMERHGGSAAIDSSAGEGTEVHLSMGGNGS